MPLRFQRKSQLERFVAIVTNFKEAADELYQQYGLDIVNLEQDIEALVDNQQGSDPCNDYEYQRATLDEEITYRKTIRKQLKSATIVPVSEQEAVAVYRELCEHPSVKGIHVDSREIVITLKPKMAYEGHLYSTGKWQLHLAVESLDLYATILETGRADNVSETRAYEFNGFCFGNNVEFLQEQLLRGNIGETLLTAVNYMSSVNAEDEPAIPLVYKTIGVAS